MGYSIIYDTLIVAGVYIVYKYVSKWKDSIDDTRALRIKQERSVELMKYCNIESEKQYNNPSAEMFEKMGKYASSLGLAYTDSKHGKMEYDFKYYAPLYLSSKGVIHSELISGVFPSEIDNEHRVKVLKAISKNLREFRIKDAHFVRPIRSQTFRDGISRIVNSQYYLELAIKSRFPPEYYDYEYERIT